MKKLLFLGNNDSILKGLLNIKDIHVIGVVADRVSKEEEKYFGSSYAAAQKMNLPVISQRDFNRNYRKYLAGMFFGTDIMFIHGYRYRIKEALTGNKGIKILNFHQSLLPSYGGRHPLNWAIINGEKSLGITFHNVNDKFDAGDIILQKKIRITGKDTVVSLYNKTVRCAIRQIPRVLSRIHDAAFIPPKQDTKKGSYLPPRVPEDGAIVKNDTMEAVKNKIKALVPPYPGAFIVSNGRRLVIDGVRKVRHGRRYAHVDFFDMVDGKPVIRCRDGLLAVTKIRAR